MKIQLTLNGEVIPATLADNDAAHEFAAMLPLTITLHDMFRREKFGPLPHALPHALSDKVACTGVRTHAYEVGELICWTPGPDLAVFYRHDGQEIRGGFHVLGKIDAGVEAFCAPGPLQVTIDVARSDRGACCRGAPRRVIGIRGDLASI